MNGLAVFDLHEKIVSCIMVCVMPSVWLLCCVFSTDLKLVTFLDAVFMVTL